MFGYLLLIHLMNSLPQLKVNAFLPPTLSVNPDVITETNLVTLNCQLPQHHHSTECYFSFIREQPVEKFPCQHTLTGGELLRITHQSLPVEMKLTCLYQYGSQFLQSETASLIIQTLLPPTLSVNPAVITETDSVTLSCQPPSFISVSECYFSFIRGQTAVKLPCLQILTGTYLLGITSQESPAQVTLTCFYLYGSQSPQSETASIIIQTSLPPTLTVNPPEISETDSVTLSCQPPSFLSVSQCHFHFIRGQTSVKLPCLQTLTGTELLRISGQKSPAQVTLTCFYLYASQSSQSETASIIVRTSLPPTLTVNPPEISETDSVTLNCQPPSSASVSQCHFYTSAGGPAQFLSCQQTLTGSELLRMSGQSSPAQVKLSCFYTEKLGEEDSPSPRSAFSSIRVYSLKPTLSRSRDGGVVVFVCSPPESAAHGAKCNLYFGETRHPEKTEDIFYKKSQNNLFICQFYFSIDDLLSRLRSVQQRDASCDYTLGRGPNPLSPRSDRYSLTDIVEKESRTTQTMSAPTKTTGLRPGDPPATTSQRTTQGLTVNPPIRPGGVVTSLQTSAEPTSETDVTSLKTKTTSVTGVSVSVPDSEDSGLHETSSKKWIWELVAAVAGCGVTVGVGLLVSAVLCNKRRAGLERVKRGSKRYQSDDMCYYSTIADKPATTALNDMTYSTVQAH